MPVAGEDAILDRITHHLACDGVHFTTLYDAVSLFRQGDLAEAGYARVLLACAARMRAAKDDESQLVEPGSLTLTPGVWYAAEFIGDEFAHQDRHYSPILVEDFKLLKTGRADLKLAFHHENYPVGVQDKIYDLRVLERASTYLLARSLAHPRTGPDPPHHAADLEMATREAAHLSTGRARGRAEEVWIAQAAEDGCLLDVEEVLQVETSSEASDTQAPQNICRADDTWS